MLTVSARNHEPEDARETYREETHAERATASKSTRELIFFVELLVVLRIRARRS